MCSIRIEIRIDGEFMTPSDFALVTSFGINAEFGCTSVRHHVFMRDILP